MKRLFVFFVIFGVSNLAFADNAVFNGSFDMTPWDSGWTKYTYADSSGPGIARTKIEEAASSTSSPNCCCFYTSAGANTYSGEWGTGNAEGIISQTFNPISNCLFKASIRDYYYWMDYWMDYCGSSSFGAEWAIRLYVKGVWQPIINGRDNYDNWTEISIPITDTVSGIQIFSNAYFSGGGAAGSLYFCCAVEEFWIDDIQITQTGVEERTNIKSQYASGGAKLGIIKNKIYLSVPNSINAKLTIYDLCGKLKEAVYNGTLTKGNYAFTPNIHKSGIYFVQLTAGNFKETKKLILVK
ncbi:MAG: T9SS type A sorting domain-containing protein [bacterium]|nr:T9SS type A sorting domain-containing protein [bacterium]